VRGGGCSVGRFGRNAEVTAGSASGGPPGTEAAISCLARMRHSGRRVLSSCWAGAERTLEYRWVSLHLSTCCPHRLRSSRACQSLHATNAPSCLRNRVLTAAPLAILTPSKPSCRVQPPHRSASQPRHVLRSPSAARKSPPSTARHVAAPDPHQHLPGARRPAHHGAPRLAPAEPGRDQEDEPLPVRGRRDHGRAAAAG
jgi:hypothetical protein